MNTHDPETALVKAYTKKELAQLYGISVDTLLKWMKRYRVELKKLGYDPDQRILTVSQVKFLFRDDKLGRP